ncbi:MAG TPA: DMT family transporter, partial [Candidatus Cloacimonadota bacterium]|nr:DMT family transporter [Candidatus Cloacimonadota bacterium]
MKNHQTYKALVLLHFSVFLFGSAGLFGKLLTISPVHITAGRLFFASISLFLLLKTRNNFCLPEKKDIILFITSGFILALHWYSFFKSIQLSSVSTGLIYFSSYPLFTNLIEWTVCRKKITTYKLISLILCITGLFITYFAKYYDNPGVISLLMGILSGLTFSILSFINQRLSKQYSVQIVSLYQFVIAFICLIPSFIMIQLPVLNQSVIMNLIILGVIFTALSHTLFINSLKYLPISSVSLISCMEPVYGILLAFLIFDEKL